MGRQVFKTPAGTAARVGDLLLTSGVAGTGGSPEEEFLSAYRNLRSLLEAAGSSPDEVAYLTVFIPDPSYRQYINPGWLELFPNENDRPARKTTQHPLPDGKHVRLQAYCVPGEKRQVLQELPDLKHRDPLPVAVRMGKMIYTSVISPPGGERVQQLGFAFDHMVELVAALGGTADDIAHVWVFLKEFGEYHDRMIDQWLATFPKDAQRAARKTIRYDLSGDTMVQLQATAVLGGGRENLEIPGIGHHDPIPLGTRTQGVVISSGIGGHSQRDYTLPETLEEQAAGCFANMKSLVELVGGTTDNIGHVTVLLKDYKDREVLERHWRAMFPDPENEPARYEMTLGLPASGMQFQVHMIAVV